MRTDINRAYGLSGGHGFQAVLPAHKGFNHVNVYATGTYGVARHLVAAFNINA